MHLAQETMDVSVVTPAQIAESTAVPTAEPTPVPTPEPTAVPTPEPTAVPTVEPTVAPTVAPTVEPTAVPTENPTQTPTETPTRVPTDEPTIEPMPAVTQAPVTTAQPIDATTAEITAAPADTIETPFDEPQPFTKGYARVKINNLLLRNGTISGAHFSGGDFVYVDAAGEPYSLVHFRTQAGAQQGYVTTEYLESLSDVQVDALVREERAREGVLYYEGNNHLPLPYVEMVIAAPAETSDTEQNDAVTPENTTAPLTEEPVETNLPQATAVPEDDPIEIQQPDDTSIPAEVQEPDASEQPLETDGPISSDEPQEGAQPDTTMEPDGDSTDEPQESPLPSEEPADTDELTEDELLPEKPTAASVALDPSISLDISGESAYFTGAQGHFDIVLNKQAGSTDHGPVSLRISIDDRYLQDIAAGVVEGTASSITRDAESQWTIVVYTLSQLPGGAVLTFPISFAAQDVAIPADYQFAIEVSLDAILPDTSPSAMEEPAAGAHRMRRLSLSYFAPGALRVWAVLESAGASDIPSSSGEEIPEEEPSTALVEPKTFTLNLFNAPVMKLASAAGTVDLAIVGNAVQVVGGTISNTLTMKRTEGAQDIQGPVTVIYTIADNSAVDVDSLSAAPGSIVTQGTVTTITYNYDGISATEELALPIGFDTRLDAAQGSSIAVSASLFEGDSAEATAMTNQTYTLFAQDMTLTGPGSFRIGADVQAITKVVRAADAPAIPGPVTLTYTFQDSSLLNIDSISGQNIGAGVPVVSTDEAGVTTVTYTLPNGIAAGADLELPIYFSSKTGIAGGSQIALSASLKAGDVVLDSQSGTYTFQNLDPSITFAYRPYPDAERWDYYTGEPATFYIDYTKVAGSGSIGPSRIRFLLEENTYLQSLNASDLSSATSKQMVYDSNNVTIGVDYYFNMLTPGTTYSIPITVTTRPNLTPDNYELNFSVAVEEQIGDAFQPVTTETTGTFTYQVIEPTFRKNHMAGSVYRYADYTATNTAFGGFDLDEDGFIDANGASLQRFDYSLVLPAKSGHYTYGTRYYNPITIIDTLPEGAVFDPARNPGWSYVEGSNQTQVQYTRETNYIAYANNSASMTSIPLYLSFPGFSYRDSFAINTAKVILTPRDGQPYEFNGSPLSPDNDGKLVLEDDIKLYFNATAVKAVIGKSRTPYSIPDQLNAKQNTEIAYTINLQNPSNDMYMTNIALDDYNMDPRLKFTGVKLYTYYTNRMIGADGQEGTGLITIQALDANNSIIKEIARDVATSDGTLFTDIPEETYRIRFLTQEGTLLPPQARIYVYVYAKLRNPAEVSHVTSPSSANHMYNTAGATYGWDGYDATDSSRETRTIVTIIPYVPKISLEKLMDKTSLFMNQTSVVTLRILEQANNALMSPDTINDLRIVDLLPANVEYVPSSARFRNYSGNPDNDFVYRNLEPIIETNYDGGTRTALIWDFSSIYAKK